MSDQYPVRCPEPCPYWHCPVCGDHYNRFCWRCAEEWHGERREDYTR